MLSVHELIGVKGLRIVGQYSEVTGGEAPCSGGAFFLPWRKGFCVLVSPITALESYVVEGIMVGIRFYRRVSSV